MSSHERLTAAALRFSGVAACVSVVVGVAVVVGWVFDVQLLKSIAPGLVSMKANTALAFVLAGAALWLLRDEDAARSRQWAGAALGVAIALFACITLAEYLLGADLRIDRLFSDPSTSLPGRPSPHTAIAFAAVGVWLALLPVRGARWARLRDGVAVIASVIVLQAAIGYLYGVKYLYGISAVTGMAVHTVVTFVILCLGVLAARPTQGFMGLLTSVGPGGVAARRLAPAILVVPLLIGYLCLKAQQLGVIGLRDGIAILAGGTVVGLGAIIAYTGLSLNRADADRRALELRLAGLAERDPLTSLYNRRRFAEELERQLARSRRYSTALALIMIDVDGLKKTNDTHGHRAGDELLLTVAAGLTAQLRATDTAARLSGDEFAVLLPHADAAGAEAVAAKLVAAVRGRAFAFGPAMILPTISAGIASGAGDPLDAATLSQAADRALYQAKVRGGDQYVSAAPQSPRTSGG